MALTQSSTFTCAHNYICLFILFLAVFEALIALLANGDCFKFFTLLLAESLALMTLLASSDIIDRFLCIVTVSKSLMTQGVLYVVVYDCILFYRYGQPYQPVLVEGY